MHEAENTGDALVPALTGERLFAARGQAVNIKWRFADDGKSITGVLSMPDTQYGLMNFELGSQPPMEDDRIYLLAKLDIRLWLDHRNHAGSVRCDVYLRGRLPLSQQEYFDGEIGLWRTAHPAPSPAPDPAPDPAPTPADAVVIDIAAPAQAADLFLATTCKRFP